MKVCLVGSSGGHLTHLYIKVIAELPYSWEKIKDKTILVSGGTGFIGTA